MSKYSIEKRYEVWDDDEGIFLRIGPDSDGLGMIEVKCGNKASDEFYGKIDFRVEAQHARLLAQALIAAADDLENKV